MGKIISILALFSDHLFEFICFVRYSSSYSLNSSTKLQGRITFNYHSLEKGLINVPIMSRFGKAKISRLMNYLKLWVVRGYDVNNSQFRSGCAVLKKYFDYHAETGQEINDIISDNEIEFFSRYSEGQEGGTISFNCKDYFSSSHSGFNEFSVSRHSVRHFSAESIDYTTIKRVISLAGNAPSVCNRQGWQVTFITRKSLVDEVLLIQSGLNSTSESVKQLLVVTVNRGVFVSVTEWYQVFIDGGIFVQNLLYALHFHEIAAVALNWSKHYFLDKKLRKLIGLDPSEKVISVIAIGYPIEEFSVPRSKRKDVSEILKIID